MEVVLVVVQVVPLIVTQLREHTVDQQAVRPIITVYQERKGQHRQVTVLSTITQQVSPTHVMEADHVSVALVLLVHQHKQWLEVVSIFLDVVEEPLVRFLTTVLPLRVEVKAVVVVITTYQDLLLQQEQIT